MGHTGALCRKKCPNGLNGGRIESEVHSSVSADDTESRPNIIGPRCTAEIVIEGKPCRSLLDSGSQVTTVSKSFYDTHLSSHPILSLLLCSCAFTSPRRTWFKVPILLKNETAHEITFPRKCCLAKLYVPSALSLPKILPAFTVVSCNAMRSTSHNKIHFDFTNFPLSEVWRNRIDRIVVVKKKYGSIRLCVD